MENHRLREMIKNKEGWPKTYGFKIGDYVAFVSHGGEYYDPEVYSRAIIDGFEEKQCDGRRETFALFKNYEIDEEDKKNDSEADQEINVKDLIRVEWAGDIEIWSWPGLKTREQIAIKELMISWLSNVKRNKKDIQQVCTQIDREIKQKLRKEKAPNDRWMEPLCSFRILTPQGDLTIFLRKDKNLEDYNIDMFIKTLNENND